MASRTRFRLTSLGFLRLGLFGLVILDLILSAGYQLAIMLMDTSLEQAAWAPIPTIVAPVMAPILVVVILFDYIMSRVRAADEPEEARRAHYLLTGRIELLFIGVMLAYWIPFFFTL